MAAVCGFLLLAVGLVFGQVVDHDFVNLDDPQYVYENLLVRDGLTVDGTVYVFTHSHLANWHPLTCLSHMLDCQVYGLRPWGHHLTSVLLHGGTVILLFLLLRRATGALWPSAVVAALFAIHPLRAESVAWVAERKDVLSGLFFMLTLGSYMRYAERPTSWSRYALLVFVYALGLMAKPMLVTVPLVLLLLDYWPLGRFGLRQRGDRDLASAGVRCRPASAWRLVIEKIPLFVLAGLSCLITLLAQGKLVGGHFRSLGMLKDLSLPWRIANAVVAYAVYLWQTFWPTKLAAFYPHPRTNLTGWEIAAACLLLAVVFAAALRSARRRPYLLVGWLWYLVMLVPVIGLVQVGGQAIADRYMYLPQIGLCIAVVWTAADLTSGWRYRRQACTAVSAVVISLLIGCAWRQVSYWRNSETLWQHALACNPSNAFAELSLGNAARQRDPREALQRFRRALAIDPQFVDAYHNMGTVFQSQKQFGPASECYQQALAIDPTHTKTLSDLGSLLFEQGKVDQAIEQFSNALTIDERLPRTQNNLGWALLQQGKIDAAIEHCRIALQLDPRFPAAHRNLGVALDRQGKSKEALAEWREGLRLQPNDPTLLRLTAWALATHPQAAIRNGPEAVELARRAVFVTNGRNPQVLDTLAAAFAETGQFPAAVATAKQALAIVSAQGDTSLADALGARIRLYQAKSPFRATPPTEGTKDER